MDAAEGKNFASDPKAKPKQLEKLIGLGEDVDRLLAEHPKATAQLLEQLSHSSDRATRKAVTVHPNTPKDALLKLAPQFPGDFFQNPAFDWLLIEHPNLMFDIGGGVLKNVLKRAECPASFMAWAAAHGSEQERLAVAMNPQAQADVLQAIERKGGKAAQAAQQHANYPLASGEGDLESAFRKAVEQAIAQEFDAIQSNTLVRDLPSLAQWPALSVAKRLESSQLMSCCVGIAVHPQAPPALAEPILNALAASTHEGARWEVAEHPGTPPAILAKLADDSDKEVRRAARAKRRAVETTFRTQLAFDSSCDGRFAFLCKPDTPADVVAQRVTSACEDAHRLVFDCRRSSWWIRSVAKLKPKDADLIQACNEGNVLFLPDHLADKACRKTELVWRLLGLSHRLAAPEDLAKRSRSTEWVERMAVARNTNTPPNIIEALGKDPHRLVVRQAEATAALKSGATERQAQLLQEMPAATTDQADQPLVEETSLRLKKLAEIEPSVYGSRWARLLAPGQWLPFFDAFDASTQTRLEEVLPAALKGAMAEFWADPTISPAALGSISLPSALLLLAERSTKKEVQERLVAKVSTPVEVLVRLAASKFEDVRRDVARNSATPGAILNSLAADKSGRVSWSAIENPAIPVATLIALAADPDPSVRQSVAENTATPTAVLSTLAGDTDERVRANVAEHPSTTADTLAKLAGDSSGSVCVTVAKNPATPATVLAALAGDESYYMRSAVAANPGTSAAILATLACDVDSRVRCEVAANPATPPAALVELACDAGDGVRKEVAANKATPVATLVTLSGDAHADVRGRVARNPVAPASALATLAGDVDADVRRAVAANHGTLSTTLAKLGGDVDWVVRAWVAENPITPPTVFARLAGDSHPNVRRAVAANPATPAATLSTLAGDSNWRVCLAAVSNPNVPSEILLIPTGDAEVDARRAGARRCAELRSALATESPTLKQSAVIQSWIDELQAGLVEPVVLRDVSDSEFRLAFDALGLMPADGDKRAIAKAAKSKDWLERAAATYAPGIQPSLLKVLLEDPVEAVRQCAVARLRVLA